MSIFSCLFVLLISSSANAATQDNLKSEYGQYKFRPYRIGDMAAKVDYQNQTIVVAANIINKNTPADELLFGGGFSPTLAMDLKPLNKSKIHMFMQARCLDYFCDDIVVGFGIRTQIGNPYAFQERKFVVMSREE